MRRLTIAQLFLFAASAIGLVVGVAFAAFIRSSRASILAKATDLRDQAAARIENELASELRRAQRALEDVEGGIRTGAIGLTDDQLLEAALFTRALADAHLEEITFTEATQVGFDPAGEAILAPEGRRQISVLRTPDGRLLTRITEPGDGGFVVRIRARPLGGSFLGAPLEPSGRAADPTAHATFTVLASQRKRGTAEWSDLHYSEADQALPTSRRRSVVSVQKAILDGGGQFRGVLRVGLLTQELNALTEEKIDNDTRDPHRIAIMAVASGGTHKVHLVAGVERSDHLAVLDGDLRIVATHPPPELAALEDSAMVASLNPLHPNGDAMIEVAGEPWLATIRELSIAQGGTTGWFVALLGPERHYTREFEEQARTLLLAFGTTLAVVLLISGLTLGAMRRNLAKIVATTTRMRAFNFAPADDQSHFQDVDDVIQGLERAKTVVRAMGKYIPVDLVRRLYDTNHEPELGGVATEVSLLFTDLEGFTALSEKLSPDELARHLGVYLQTMTAAIEATGGTIDKYIGDAVMAFWNAPTPTEGHCERACRAAVSCQDALRELYASPAWAGLPPMRTRFGLHTASVLVGNFGAPTRLSYTALGDGVNLAARLEPLCKQYGIVSLVSETTVAGAGSGFVFRHIDRVAVKGKSKGIDVYELLGSAGDALPGLPMARSYEKAFEAYLARRFADAIEILTPQADRDAPSAVLLARCREFELDPPPQGWDGVHVAHSK